MDLHYQSASSLVKALVDKQISSVELLEASISRIESLDKNINAIVVRDFERARRAAISADASLARGERQLLLGLPMTVKESFNVVGLPTTWGNPIYKGWQPRVDALVVTRLKAAGAVILGKTNVPFMLRDWQSYNEIYGTTNNPWDLARTPGGSSGGSAAALAAGFVSLELGTDLAGSLRAPAHYCGIFAHKPSHNLIPIRGAGPPTTPWWYGRADLVVAGPMARTATDLALALNILAGPDKLVDGIGYKLSLPRARHDHLRNFRVLILNAHPLYPTSAAITTSIDYFAEHLRKLGVSVSHSSHLLPDLAEIARIYTTLLNAFVAADVPKEIYQKSETAAKALSVEDNSLAACRLRGSTFSHRDWILVTRMREQLRQQWRDLVKEFDVVLCPVMPTLAFPHDQSPDVAVRQLRQLEVNGLQFPYIDQIIWPSIATLLDLPVTVAPIDRSAEGLPIGIQIIGGYLEDYTTIAFASMIEREFGGFSPPPLKF